MMRTLFVGLVLLAACSAPVSSPGEGAPPPPAPAPTADPGTSGDGTTSSGAPAPAPSSTSDKPAPSPSSTGASTTPPPPAKGPDGVWHLPDPTMTPGVLCTSSDPNFDGYVYSAQIAHCVRNVSASEKAQVGAEYGIAPADFASYEFDHYIPLSIGGSDDIGNLWPQPLDEAQQKDVVEEDAYTQLKNGQITQAQAVAMIKAWRPK